MDSIIRTILKETKIVKKLQQGDLSYEEENIVVEGVKFGLIVSIQPVIENSMAVYVTTEHPYNDDAFIELLRSKNFGIAICHSSGFYGIGSFLDINQSMKKQADIIFDHLVRIVYIAYQFDGFLKSFKSIIGPVKDGY